MRIVFSGQFKKEFRKIKDSGTQTRIMKAIQALAEFPEKGKHLGNVLHGKRSVRITPHRLLYEFKQGDLVVLCFDHRKTVYKHA